VKHWCRVPFPDAQSGGSSPEVEVHQFLSRHGWHVTSMERAGSGIHTYGRGEWTWLRLTIAPTPRQYLAPDGEITVTSGAMLIYDDIDRSMAVSLRPEPQDAAHAAVEAPEDAAPTSLADVFYDARVASDSRRPRRRLLGQRPAPGRPA
jgi:hypothetical protein